VGWDDILEMVGVGEKMMVDDGGEGGLLDGAWDEGTYSLGRTTKTGLSRSYERQERLAYV
jgi:hypothetical protein